MNKPIFKILPAVVLWIFTACEAEHSGYLFSSEAAYPIDSLVVQSPATQQHIIAEMEAAKENFEATEEGQELYRQKEKFLETIDSLNTVIDNLIEELYAIEDQLYELDPDSDEYAELEREYYRLDAEIRNPEGQVHDIREIYIKDIDKQIAQAIGNIESELVLMRRRLDNHVAYSSSGIDKMDGTAPLIYTIAGIKVEGKGDAGKFSDYVSVMGSGRFLIGWDENIPLGRYVISLYVENEGWKDLLPDVFTVVVE